METWELSLGPIMMPVKHPSEHLVAVGYVGTSMELKGKVLAEDKNVRVLIMYIIFKAIR